MYKFKNVYLKDWYTIVGPLESESNLKNYNQTISDYYFGEKTFEKAEIKMQNTVLDNLLEKNSPELIIGSDLLNQLIISNMSLKNRNIPYLGLYSACASSVGALITLSSMIDSHKIKEGLFITSAHNLTAEKQYRFPVEYGSPKPIRSTFTTTASVGIVLTNKKTSYKIVNGTIGCVVDSYLKDTSNMGGVMAIGAAHTCLRHFKETNTSPNDYDLILSGDLGKAGENIFKELMKRENFILKNYKDAGTLIYQNKDYSGGSGPAVLPLVFLSNIINNKKYKRILLLATGSLHSPTLVNQKNTIPTITHALTIEVIK